MFGKLGPVLIRAKCNAKKKEKKSAGGLQNENQTFVNGHCFNFYANVDLF